MQQGGLWVALGEECCFHIDPSGAVKETMALLREGLQKRRLERKRLRSWYESLFNWFPLISALIGPLIILLLLLTCSPYIINRSVQFIKEQIGVVPMMVLHTRYGPPPMEKRWGCQPTHDWACKSHDKGGMIELHETDSMKSFLLLL